MLNTSILEDIKNQVLSAVDPEDSEYDQAIITHTNSAFARLMIAGCGPVTGFAITGYNETWGDYIQNTVYLSLAREYIVRYVALNFSPPDNGTIANMWQKDLEDKLVLINHVFECYDYDDVEGEAYDSEKYKEERKSVWEKTKGIYHPKT